MSESLSVFVNSNGKLSTIRLSTFENLPTSIATLYTSISAYIYLNAIFHFS